MATEHPCVNTRGGPVVMCGRGDVHAYLGGLLTRAHRDIRCFDFRYRTVNRARFGFECAALVMCGKTGMLGHAADSSEVR